MTLSKRLPVVCGWILFLFGCLNLADGALALVSGSPCWVVRIGLALASFLLISIVGFLGEVTELKVLVTVSGWLVFAVGGLALVFGIYTRFTRFDDFKLWQWAMALGTIAIFLTAVIAFIAARLEASRAG